MSRDEAPGRGQIELRHLRALVAVVEEGNFSRAAARLFIAQPALSQQIKFLERELGAPVFLRTSHGVVLTPAGRTLVPRARRALAVVEDGLEAVRLILAGHVARLRIGYPHAGLHPLMQRAIREFGRRRSDLEVTEVAEAFSPELRDQLLSGMLDVAFIRGVSPEHPNLSREIVGQELLTVAVPEGHPLAQEPAIEIDQLARLPFISFPRDRNPAAHDSMTSGLRTSATEPRIGPPALTFEAMHAAIRSGAGYTLLTGEQACSLSNRGIAFRPPAEPITLPIALEWRTDGPVELVRSFVSFTSRLARRSLSD